MQTWTLTLWLNFVAYHIKRLCRKGCRNFIVCPFFVFCLFRRILAFVFCLCLSVCFRSNSFITYTFFIYLKELYQTYFFIYLIRTILSSVLLFFLFISKPFSKFMRWNKTSRVNVSAALIHLRTSLWTRRNKTHKKNI